MTVPIEGQMNEAERQALRPAVVGAAKRPRVVLEVGTWLDGGSTVHLLRALEENGEGHLWDIEADRSIYERMVANIEAAAPQARHRFTPLFGFSQEVIPRWIAEQPQPLETDLAFLDGGNRPMEQITEFHLLDPHMPVGAQLFAHDARMRKGKWLVPYVSLLDNWESQLLDTSEVGLFHAIKKATRPSAESERAARRKLLQMRLEPAEIAAALLPSSVKGLALRMLPSKLSRRLSDGVTQ
jgi:hypothetical protein